MDAQRLAVRLASNSKFSGRSGDRWEKWLSHFDLRFRDVEEKERVGFLIDLLEGPALDVLARLGPKELSDYRAVTKTLSTAFRHDVSSLHAYAELGKAEQQPGEEVEAFGARIIHLVKAAYPKATEEEAQENGLKQFVCGLSDGRLQEQLINRHELKSLQDALDVARHHNKKTDTIQAVRARKQTDAALAVRQQPRKPWTPRTEGR